MTTEKTKTFKVVIMKTNDTLARSNDVKEAAILAAGAASLGDSAWVYHRNGKLLLKYMTEPIK